jgi:hypothetical protein
LQHSYIYAAAGLACMLLLPQDAHATQRVLFMLLRRLMLLWMLVLLLWLLLWCCWLLEACKGKVLLLYCQVLLLIVRQLRHMCCSQKLLKGVKSCHVSEPSNTAQVASAYV